MSNKNPFITIIIPTRDRSETLSATLKTCISQDYDNLEIIISDNYSKDNTFDVVNSFNDKRLKYIKTPHRISMSSNYEYALQSMSKEGFVSIIGDDDGLMPESILKFIKLQALHNVEAVVSPSIYYAWSSFVIESERNIIICKDSKKIERMQKSRDELIKLIRYDGHERNYIWNLPGIYRNYVDKKVINKAKVNSKYFHSITPDAYSAIVNSLFIEEYLFTNQSLFIEGVSGKSNGASQLLGKNNEEENKFIAENDHSFHKKLVYAPSAPIVLAEAFFQVKERFPKECVKYDIQIQSICQSAINNAVTMNEERVLNSIENILSINSLPNVKLKKNKFTIFCYRIKNLISYIGRTEINCNHHKINDVYQASLLFHHLNLSFYNSSLLKGWGLIIEKILIKLKVKNVSTY